MDKEFGDLIYDVWRSGGSPDQVSRDEFECEHGGRYDWMEDRGVLRRELDKQTPSY